MKALLRYRLPLEMALAMAALLVLVTGCTDGQRSQTSSSKPEAAPQQDIAESKAAPQWYEGGTLHDKTLADWHAGTDADRLATAGDWISNLVTKGELVVDIRSMDDLKVLAIKLRTCMNEAYDENTATQSSAEVAVWCMVLMGWIK